MNAHLVSATLALGAGLGASMLIITHGWITIAFLGLCLSVAIIGRSRRFRNVHIAWIATFGALGFGALAGYFSYLLSGSFPFPATPGAMGSLAENIGIGAFAGLVLALLVWPVLAMASWGGRKTRRA